MERRVQLITDRGSIPESKFDGDGHGRIASGRSLGLAAIAQKPRIHDQFGLHAGGRHLRQLDDAQLD